MLEDLLQENLNLVICGTAVGNNSAQVKQYYAGRGNKFWTTLFEIGLTPELLFPVDYSRLISFGIGLTDLVKTQSGMDKSIDPEEFGRNELRSKIIIFQPKYLCFNGKRAGEEFLNRPVDYGLQTEKIGITELFVAPSTSGAAMKWWDIKPWVDLAKLCKGEGNG